MTTPALLSGNNNTPTTPESKQGSPFYAEPADSIACQTNFLISVPRRRIKNNNFTTTANKFRHSEPSWSQTPIIPNYPTNTIDWNEETTEGNGDKTPLISTSVDNISKRLSGANQAQQEVKKIPRAKPVQPPKIRPKASNDASWQVDSSWEFIGTY